jgi:hypothetical protein
MDVRLLRVTFGRELVGGLPMGECEECRRVVVGKSACCRSGRIVEAERVDLETCSSDDTAFAALAGFAKVVIAMTNVKGEQC